MERYKLKVAVYIILIMDNKVLLARRLNTGWQDGNYGLPAGHLEEGEGVIDALIREIKEETDITLRAGDVELVHTMHRRGKYIDLFFTVANWEGQPKILETDKCDSIGWFQLDHLPQNIIPSVKAAIINYQEKLPFSEFDLED